MADPMDDIIASLNRLAAISENTAKAAAPIVLKAFQATANAGTTPDGKPWAPKKNGDKPLKNAAKALTSSVSGTVVVVKLEGVEVIHNYGNKKDPKRQIIPDRFDYLPKSYSQAIKSAADAEFAKITGAR